MLLLLAVSVIGDGRGLLLDLLVRGNRGGRLIRRLRDITGRMVGLKLGNLGGSLCPRRWIVGDGFVTWGKRIVGCRKRGMDIRRRELRIRGRGSEASGVVSGVNWRRRPWLRQIVGRRVFSSRLHPFQYRGFDRGLSLCNENGEVDLALLLSGDQQNNAHPSTSPLP